MLSLSKFQPALYRNIRTYHSNLAKISSRTFNKKSSNTKGIDDILNKENWFKRKLHGLTNNKFRTVTNVYHDVDKGASNPNSSENVEKLDINWLKLQYFDKGKYEARDYYRQKPNELFKKTWKYYASLAFSWGSNIAFGLIMIGGLIVFMLAKAFMDKFVSSIEIGSPDSSSSSSHGHASDFQKMMQETPAPVEKPDTKFSDIRGMSEIMEQLEQVKEIFTQRSKYTNMGLEPPKGILLSSPPGCGKTLIGRALAGEVNVPFYFIAASQVNGMFVGTGAKKLAKIFQEARKHPEGAIIFFDEIDAIGGKRDPKGSNTNPYSRLTINKLLNEMDGFKTSEKVLVIGSTNFEKVLDPALTRSGRFDLKLQIPLPNREDRKEILEYYLSKVTASPVIDIEKYAKMLVGSVGADFKNIVNTAAQFTTQRRKDLVDDLDIMDAIKRVFLGVEQRERFKDLTPLDLKVTAYQQAAEAVISIKLKDRRELSFLTIMPRNGKSGLTKFRNISYDENINKTDFFIEIKANIAKSIAQDRITKEIFGKVNRLDEGMKNENIENARNKLYQMVSRFGMGQGDAQIMYHVDLATCSQKLRNLVTIEAERLFKICETEALENRDAYWKDITFIAEALLEYETLSGKEVKKLLECRRMEVVKEDREASRKDTEEKAAERKKHLLIDMERMDFGKDEEGEAPGEKPK